MFCFVCVNVRVYFCACVKPHTGADSNFPELCRRCFVMFLGLLCDLQNEVIAFQVAVDFDVNFSHGARKWGVHYRLHLHGAEDAQRLAFLHLLALLDLDLNHFSWHGCSNLAPHILQSLWVEVHLLQEQTERKLDYRL